MICLAEIWKTTPFISLLLLAGLAQVPDVLQEAAKVDGATCVAAAAPGDAAEHEGGDHGRRAVPHPGRVPHLRHVFIMTAGANSTETVSFLAYRQTIERVEIGLGSAVSVLLFLSVVLISALFIKGFKVDLSQARGE